MDQMAFSFRRPSVLEQPSFRDIPSQTRQVRQRAPLRVRAFAY